MNYEIWRGFYRYNGGMRILQLIEWGPKNVWVVYGELRHRDGCVVEESNDMRACVLKKWISHANKDRAKYKSVKEGKDNV